MNLEVRLLGPFEIRIAGTPVELPSGRLPALVAVLALEAGRTVPVDRLVDAVWGEGTGVDARANLQTTVRRLRRLLGADAVVTHGTGYALRVEPDQVDAVRFVRLLEPTDPTTERARLTEALGLWRGAPFEGLEQVEAVRLEERYLTTLERRFDLDLADGARPDPAGLQASLDRHPLRESLWVRLLIALERTGRPAEALERYETVRSLLADELGTDPGPELQKVYADLLAGRPPAPVGSVVPRQLPIDANAFTGRDSVLAALDRLLDRDATTMPVAIVTGTAGVGKTTLAVRWAHRVAEHFPGGQLYVDLRGFDPTGTPMAPAEALRGFLDALGVPPQRIPADLEARAGLYRSVLADTRTLVVLDNAHDAGQVAPLLPAAPGCLVLVTSRNQMPGLVASAAARPLALDLLDRDEAIDLLTRRLGPDRLAAEPAEPAEPDEADAPGAAGALDALGAIVTRCAGLPLALALVAARAAIRPHVPLAAIAAELDPSGGSGDLGGLTAEVRAVFSWSYRSLGPDAARLFGLLGLHPGPDITVATAASLAASSARDVRAALAELAGAHLVEERSAGRYGLHDLLRAYARELIDADPDREAATRRLLDHYLHTAHAADLRLFRHGETIVLDEAAPGVSAEPIEGDERAIAWFTAEHRALLAVIELAGAEGFDRHACHLAWSVFVFLHRQGRRYERITTQHAALAAAQRLGDPEMLSRAYRYLGTTYADVERFDEAHAHLGRALELAEQRGDLVDQAWTHYYRELAYGLQGRFDDALAAAERTLRLFDAAGHRVGRAIALTDLGWFHGRLGDLDSALLECERALDEHREVGNRAYQAHTWSCLAEIHRDRGETAAALEASRQALGLFEALGDRYGEASILVRLGDLTSDTPDSARELWQRAYAIFARLDPDAAADVRDRLRA